MSKSGIINQYLTGLTVVFFILIVGILLELFVPLQLYNQIQFPLNAEIGILYICLLFIIHAYYRRKKPVQWLRSIPAAVSAISLFTLLSLMMGFIPQFHDSQNSSLFQKLGLNSIRTTWYFLLSGLFLLTSLGLTIFKRLKKFTLKNTGFFMNHFGLFLVILAGSLGSADLYRLSIRVQEGEASNIGYDRDSKAYELPFKIRLKDFQIDEYNPKVAFISNQDRKIIKDLKPNPFEVSANEEITVGSFIITVEKFYPHAKISEEGLIAVEDTSNTFPAALLEVTDRNTGETKSQWISSGNHKLPPVFMKLDEQYSLAMMNPQPKKYRSLVTIFTDEGRQSRIIEVNQPVKIKGWKLYQSGYDQQKGKDSEISIFEAVRDPWLPVVYTGLFMMLLGGVYLLWIGKEKNPEKKKT